LGELGFKGLELITVKLSGGLGNQMFQYALGRNLAIRHKTPLALDISSYILGEGVTAREFLLSDFEIEANVVNHTGVSTRIASRIWNKFEHFVPYYLKREVRERGFEFDKNILKATNNSCLIGYWQSEKYFKEISSVIATDFRLKATSQWRNPRLLQVISGSNSVSVHFRRGDYVSNKEVMSVHGVCDLEYYTRALDALKKMEADVQLIIFSDGKEWVRENFKVDQRLHFVDNECTASEEIILMSMCKHNIIANSTFSWWGAWLNQNPDKVVIAPKNWFLSKERNSSDIIPETWITV